MEKNGVKKQETPVTEIQVATKEGFKLPTVAELFEDNIELAGRVEGLNAILATPPPVKWVKDHPIIKQEITNEQGQKVKVPYKYLPIDKVEFLLRKVFKEYAIEVLREGTAFNGVYVVVRVHYYDPATGKMRFHDGIGAAQLQTKSGTSPADLINVNNGAVSMAFPMAKTLAIKDATDHFGELFGCNLNRRDTLAFTIDSSLIEKQQIERYSKALTND